MPPILIRGMDDMQKMATIYSPIYTIAYTLTDNSFYQQTIQTIS